MMKSRLSLVSLVVALSHWVPHVSAWSLADRLSGRAFPPHRPRRQSLKARRRLSRNNDDTDTASSSSTSRASTKQNQQDMVDFIQQPMDSTVGDLDLPPKTTPEQDELADFVRCIVKAADGRKAENIVAMRVSHCSTLTSFIVIVSGNSRPQNQAIAAAITDDVEEEYGMRPGGSGVPEGSAESGWILLDYGSVMCHIMAPKSRLFYNVEGQWRDKGGEYMDLSDVLIPNTLEQEAGKSFTSEEDDPFWS